MYTQEQKRILVSTARSSIQHGLQSGNPETIQIDNYAYELQDNRAIFITLKIARSLRGCIGTLEAKSPLIKNVAEYAYAAAFRDPRFKPLNQNEFQKIILSISILTPAESIQFNSDSDLIQQLNPNIDGLIIQSGHRSATFLPAVWDSLPVAKDFLSQLKVKARIPPQENLAEAWRYKAIEIHEDNV